YDGEDGYWILSAFQVDVESGADDADGSADADSPQQAIMPVVRGWVSQPDPAYLDVPDGEVELTGFLAASDPAEAGLDPQIQTGAHVGAVSPAQLVNIWGGPMYSGQLRAEAQEPAGAFGSLPDPVHLGPPVTEDAGLNIRNLAYAAEWWICGGFARVLSWRMARDGVHHIRLDRAANDAVLAA